MMNLLRPIIPFIIYMSCFRSGLWINMKRDCQNSIYWCKIVLFGILSHFSVGLLHVCSAFWSAILGNCVYIYVRVNQQSFIKYLLQNKYTALTKEQMEDNTVDFFPKYSCSVFVGFLSNFPIDGTNTQDCCYPELRSSENVMCLILN
jgi:hypothetical protein